MCNLVWTTHLKQRFESAAKLINKTEKVPNERLCYQEVGISDSQMAHFLGLCITFLDIFFMSVSSYNTIIQFLAVHVCLFLTSRNPCIIVLSIKYFLCFIMNQVTVSRFQGCFILCWECDKYCHLFNSLYHGHSSEYLG